MSLFQSHVSNCVSVGHRFKVPVESGLDDEKALEILALYVNGKSSQTLPEQARSIVKECKGSYKYTISRKVFAPSFPDTRTYKI